MRILGVRFKNLNSLAGEWQVDFTRPAYISDGIFAITGPTGSGKTTLMDAVCLALYGSTPRLGKVTKSGNEIMSRQTGECFAEVTFETAKGRYRCHWSQQRAYKKPDGELQQARHEIADADSGRVLKSKINEVGTFIEKVTGLDFERFTRSMLLAQGGFAAFLQAPPHERAPILEQITGTEIYSRISMKVHERRSEELDKLELSQAELKGIAILSEEEERALQDTLRKKQDWETELTGRIKEGEKALAWLEGMAVLEKELEELDRKRQNFELRQKAFEPDSHRLERSLLAMSLEGDFRGIAALRELQTQEMKELHDAVATLPEKEKTATEGLFAREKAESLLNEARTRQHSEGEVLKKVRDLDSRLGEQEKQLVGKDRVIAEIESQEKEYGSLLEQGKQKWKEVHAALEAIYAYREKFAADEALIANFSAIERGFASLRDVEAKRNKACRELVAAAAQKDSALAELADRKGEHEKIRRVFEKTRKAHEDVREELSVILQGREFSTWRDETDVLRERERLLTQTEEILKRIDRIAPALDSLKTQLEILNADRDRILSELKACFEHKALLEKTTAALEAQVSLLNRIRDLEEERKRLADGRPCPLCGATEHPYARGNIPAPNEVEEELQKTKNELNSASNLLNRLEAERARTEAGIQHSKNEREEKAEALKTDEKQAADFLSRLQIEASPPERAARIRAELATVKAITAEMEKIIRQAEGKDKQEKSARDALDKARKTFERVEKALQEARHNAEKAAADHERSERDCATLTEEMDKARADALADVKPFGITRLPLEKIEVLLNGLRARKEAWHARENEKTLQQKTLDELKAGIEKREALLASLEEDLAARRRDREKLVRDRESLFGVRRALFGEKIADEEEKRLTAEVEKAGNALEKARENCGKIEKEISMLRERIASLQIRTKQRAGELTKAKQHWDDRLRRSGFADESDFLSSCLTEEERQGLLEKKQILLREKAELDARRQDRLETIAAQREKKLTDQSPEVLKEQIHTGDMELKQLRLDIGGMVQNLSDNESRRKNLQERLQRIDRQKRECARWDDLHQLIGSADGRKFRNFAQGLTFEMMTVHANRRLREMTDRYLLIHDEAHPLELNVIDNYQAGEIRSTKNLSGGESFIVSLALALGLSQMASRNVRVDSLFLDEGFGTLDEDALETALETLAGLRQDGKLIGIISHVAALKERIGTQIQVIPETGGRSILSGPGCRRM